jgi:hypothetical protein
MLFSKNIVLMVYVTWESIFYYVTLQDYSSGLDVDDRWRSSDIAYVWWHLLDIPLFLIL